MKRNSVAIFLAVFLLIVFAAQCRVPGMTASLTVRTGEHDAYRFAASLIAHGSATHVIVNSAALIILLYGFGRRTSAFLIVHALPVALCAVWIYTNSLMPSRAWLCGASPLFFALFGLIAWQERKTSVFCPFGLRCLSLPPLPMLGIVLLVDALFSTAFFSFIAWPVHTLAGVGGLMTGMLLSAVLLIYRRRSGEQSKQRIMRHEPFNNLARSLSWTAVITLGLFSIALMQTGCTALRYADVKPDGTKTTFMYASLEVFRERSVTGSYSPTNGVDLSITRRDTLTPDKVEAISKGVIAGMKAGI
jgi:hypothetical protein